MTGFSKFPAPIAFFTLRLADGHDALLTQHSDTLHRALRTAKMLRPFEVDSLVVLPKVIHTIWALPMHDAELEPRINLFKALFAQAVGRDEAMDPDAIWDADIWTHPLQDTPDIDTHYASV